MRITHLFAFAAPLAILLPLNAQAAWPAGEKAQYMKDCVAAASQSIDAKSAQQHCKCGADVLDKQLSSAEIQALMSTKTPPPPELRDKALKAISVCKAK